MLKARCPFCSVVSFFGVVAQDYARSVAYDERLLINDDEDGRCATRVKMELHATPCCHLIRQLPRREEHLIESRKSPPRKS